VENITGNGRRSSDKMVAESKKQQRKNRKHAREDYSSLRRMIDGFSQRTIVNRVSCRLMGRESGEEETHACQL
jgi:hypothetical protein